MARLTQCSRTGLELSLSFAGGRVAHICFWLGMWELRFFVSQVVALRTASHPTIANKRQLRAPRRELAIPGIQFRRNATTTGTPHHRRKWVAHISDPVIHSSNRLNARGAPVAICRALRLRKVHPARQLGPISARAQFLCIRRIRIYPREYVARLDHLLVPAGGGVDL